MSTFALTINNLTVAYGNKPVLWNINATIPQGVLLAIAGPNGAGKSTLIKSIVELVKPLAGTINILGGTYHQHRHHVAYVPQRAMIDWNFPVHVLDVVLMGRYGHIGLIARPQKKDIDLALSALERVGLLAYAHQPIGHLSCGQQQRVFLARALVQDASVYLMDEPFVGIDSITEKATIGILKELRDAGKTIVIVHHDLHTLQEYFDWLLLLNIERIACGPLDNTFKQEYLSTAYGKQPIHASL